MDNEQKQQTADLIEQLKKNIKDVSVTINANTKIYEFSVSGASLKSFKKDFVKLQLKCKEQTPPPKQPVPPPEEQKQEQKQQTPITIQPKQEPKPKPKAIPPSKIKTTKTSKTSKKPTSPVPTSPPIQPAQSLSAKQYDATARVDTPTSPSGREKRPKLRKHSSAKKQGASKAIFGSVKHGREKRLYLADANTFKGCEYMPMFKISERGCILRKSNTALQKKGIIKKSQIEKFNGVDMSGEGIKKIKKMITEYSKLNKAYTVQFEIPEIELNTLEITFVGPFCPNVEFVSEYNGCNYIVKSIENANKYLVNKAELKPGYKLFKVKGNHVLGKAFKDIKKELDKCGRDNRVSYQVVFLEGKMNWYNFTDPNVENDDDEKKIDLPKVTSRKSSSGKSPRKPRKNTAGSPRKSPRKSPRGTPKNMFPSPIPTTPTAKNPKYFLRDKKNVKVYMDMRIEGDKRGRIEIVLFMNIVPKTATNFLKLCTGDNKKKLTYKGKKFYKMYIGMGIEGGDVENNDGSGKSSIYGEYFEDENFKIRHAQYCLSMKNLDDEPHTNSSQFYIITADDAEFLDGKNVVFGYIANEESQQLVDDMEEEGCSLTGKPKVKVVISKCGKCKK